MTSAKKCLRLLCFEWDLDEIWQDSFLSKCASNGSQIFDTMAYFQDGGPVVCLQSLLHPLPAR